MTKKSSVNTPIPDPLNITAAVVAFCTPWCLLSGVGIGIVSILHSKLLVCFISAMLPLANVLSLQPIIQQLFY